MMLNTFRQKTERSDILRDIDITAVHAQQSCPGCLFIKWPLTNSSKSLYAFQRVTQDHHINNNELARKYTYLRSKSNTVTESIYALSFKNTSVPTAVNSVISEARL